MRTAIIYYSMSGNTDYVANKMAEKLKGSDEIDIIKIEPQKAYPDKGALKFFWGGKSAVMGEKPKLLPYSFSSGDYDRIIIGTPVWASNFAPPIRTFIFENQNIREKKVAVFACCSGDAVKAIDRMRKYIGIDRFEAELVLIDPKDKIKPEDDDKINSFCKNLL